MEKNYEILVIILSFVFIFILILFKRQNIKVKPARIGILGYRIFYTDQKEDKKRRKSNVIYSKILYSEKYDIQGKPDYIFKSIIGNKLVPVELKSGTISENNQFHEGDLMQLAAYFLIIEDVFGIKPKEGRLVYKNKMFIVKNTKKLRRQVLETVEDMRYMFDTGKGEKAKSSFVKCRYCMCRGTVCEFCKS